MDHETRYARPDQTQMARLVTDVLTEAGDRTPPVEWEWVESGSGHVSVLTDAVACRIARDGRAHAELERSQRLVDSLPMLPFRVPRSVGSVARRDGLLAVATERIRGTVHPVGSGDPQTLRALVDAIHDVDIDHVSAHTATPHAFCGGEDWETVLRELVVPRLPSALRQIGRRIVADLAALEPPARVLNHGDLAGWNVLWSGDSVAGVLDWDLASRDDPADDIASLADWHGWQVAPHLADKSTIQRAKVISQSFPLQTIGFALTRNRPAEELERTIGRAAERIRRRSVCIDW